MHQGCFLNSGYPSVPNLLAARREHQTMMITPLFGDSSWQTKTGNGYSRDDFTIGDDTRRRRITVYPRELHQIQHAARTAQARIPGGP